MTRSDLRATDLEQRLQALCDAQPFVTRFHVRHLASGTSIARDGGTPTPSASTRKIAYLMAALHAVHEGRLDLGETLELEPRLLDGVVSGVFYFMTPGLKFPLRDALVQMIITSDNTCTSLIGERLGVPALNAFCARAGMSGTRIRHIVPPRELPVDSDFDFVAETTADDQVHLLEQILRGADDAAAATALGCTPALCRMALDILSWQGYRTLIPGLLPIDTRVAHKTGSGRNGMMDAGIVYRRGAPLYAIAAYTDRVPWTLPDGLPGHAAATHTIASISRACWDAWGEPA